MELTAQQSRRNVFASAAAAFMGFTGFTIVMPFLPLYIQQLGVEDMSQVAMWSGLTLAATPAVTAVSAPLWGRVGDRFGSKLLVLRSLLAFVLTKAAMAFVTAPWQLFGLRALLGVFAGYGALTVSMAAESVPQSVQFWAEYWHRLSASAVHFWSPRASTCWLCSSSPSSTANRMRLAAAQPAAAFAASLRN